MKKIFTLLPIIGLVIGIVAIATESRAHTPFFVRHVPVSISAPFVSACIEGYHLLLDTKD